MVRCVEMCIIATHTFNSSLTCIVDFSALSFRPIILWEQEGCAYMSLIEAYGNKDSEIFLRVVLYIRLGERQNLQAFLLCWKVKHKVPCDKECYCFL